MFARTVVIVLVAAAVRAEDTLQDCFHRGSLECAKDLVARSVRSYLGDDSADLLEAVVYNKDPSGGGSVSVVSEGGKGLSVKDPRARGVVEGVSSGRSFANDSSQDKTNNNSGLAVEGRGKKMKKILEYLIALKMLYFIWGMVGYVLVALVAKMALLKSSLALGLAGVFLLKKLLVHSYHHVLTKHGAGQHYEPPTVTNYGPPAAYGHPDQHHHGANVAYGAHHPDRK